MAEQIEIENLFFSYSDNEKCLEGINLTVKRGEFIGVIGHSGSGKSTLLKHLNGILRPDSGKVMVLDTLIDKKSKNLKELRKKVGIVFQFPDEQLFSDTVLDDLLFAPKKFKVDDKIIEKELENIKHIFRLDECIFRRNYRGLSGGEKRRVAIASVVIMSPQILVLDEPTIGLDYENKTALLESLKLLNSRGVTIIIVSHDLDAIWGEINRVILMEKGKIKFDGEKNQLLKQIDEFNKDYKFVPHYIDVLYKNNLLKGNEELVNTKAEAIAILKHEYMRCKSGE